MEITQACSRFALQASSIIQFTFPGAPDIQFSSIENHLGQSYALIKPWGTTNESTHGFPIEMRPTNESTQK